MAIHTTSIALSTTPVALISSATTWGNTNGASLYDTVPFAVFNPSTALDIHLTGSSASTVGMPLVPRGFRPFDLLKSDAVWAVTTAGTTGTAIVQAGRQIGGV